MYGGQLRSVVRWYLISAAGFGPAPAVLQAVRETDWSRYPGDDEEPLRRCLAERACMPPEQVVLGNGSAELMWLIAIAALRPGDRVGIVGPTFGEYTRAVSVVGATPIEVGDPRDAGFMRALFVCNPNNPSGQYRRPEEIAHLLEKHLDQLLVLDEASAPFVQPRAHPRARERPGGRGHARRAWPWLASVPAETPNGARLRQGDAMHMLLRQWSLIGTGAA